ncbi:TIGR02594 family protein [Pseudomonas luteola]|uniref:NlpC/P60 family protein n=1 Tax=Pseudomonas luteola TaxID=47886 RepID=UPI001EF45F99|nr:TIGR02594 family protein [Pseudomonas luteola]MCG7373997.1 TIGR02594 family protein [Pseudomonas luteola]
MDDTQVSAIQSILREQGFLSDEVDGIWGRETIAAVKSFQSANHLVADGIVGPKTLHALQRFQPALAFTIVLPWFEEANRLIGTEEVLGKRSNPVILDWADRMSIDYAGDHEPWCGLFVAHCIGSTMTSEPLISHPLRARAWAKAGMPSEPGVGAIMIFWRESEESEKGHVGFYSGEDSDSYRILGGNQSEKVCFTWIHRSRLLACRWPHTGASLLPAKFVIKMDRREQMLQQEA